MANGAEVYSVRRGPVLGSVYAHPAFPAIVAGWFAALLGGGSLALPADLIARLAKASGIAQVFPAAGAPLGFTARATIAIAGVLAGIALGQSLARRVVRSERAATTDGLPMQSAPACRPIDVAEDLGEEGIAATGLADDWLEDIPLERATAGLTEQQAIEPDNVAQANISPSLDDLGLMQLTARLGSSLNERRTRRAARGRTRAAPDPAYPVDFGPFEASDAHEAARGVADFFSPVARDGTGDNRPLADSVARAAAPAAAPRSGQSAAELLTPRTSEDRHAAKGNLLATRATLEQESGGA